MQLGPFSVEHPFILAPMAGITHSPFRRLMRRLGSSLVVSELVSANGLEFQGARTQELLSFHEEERLVGIQIFGENSEFLCRAAMQIEQLGADFVDLNLGCPVPKVVKKGAGSALCRDPQRLGILLRELKQSIQIPLTIKIRTGWDESSKNAAEVIRVAQDAGVSWVVVHGRTRAQGYSGKADWDFIGNLKAKAKIPIIGNGDVTHASQALFLLKNYQLDGIMIGRAALKNPFLLMQCQKEWSGQAPFLPETHHYLDCLKTMQALLQEGFGPSRAFLQAKKFLSWFCSGFPGCHDFRSKIFSSTDEQDLWTQSFDFFEQKTRNIQDPSTHSEPFLMGGHG